MLSSQRLWPRLWSSWVAFILLPPENLSRLLAREQCGEIIIKQVADALYRQVRGRTSGDGLRIVCILALTRKYRGYAVIPDFLDRVQNARLVIDDDIVLSRVAPLDVIQRLFFVNIDEHVAVYSVEDAGAFDLARLKDHIAVRENHRLPP